METIYIYKLENGELMDSYTGANNDECEKWANDTYGCNDYYYTYSREA